MDRPLRNSEAFTGNKSTRIAYVANAPNADMHTIDVSFQALKDIETVRTQ